jgi:uncharacterized membrane protein
MVPAGARPVTRRSLERAAHAKIARVLGSEGATRQAGHALPGRAAPALPGRVFAALPWLAYPLAVWAGLALGGVRLAGGLVLGALALRSLVLWRRRDARRLAAPLLAAGLPALAALALDDALLLLFAPALVSLGLLGAFAVSLWRGPPVVESVARLQMGTLSEAEVRYCRGVTLVWCVFFAANALATTLLALTGSLAAWALWTGVFSYVAIGLVLAAELTVRAWRFRRYTGGPTDVVMRRLFPPRSDA